MDHDVALEFDHLTKRFSQIVAVDDVSFTVGAGEVFGFLGPNGAGKTTTIRCVMDFLRPSSGQIRIFGQNSYTGGVTGRQRIGYMPPFSALNEKWTGRDHVEYIGQLHHTANRAETLADDMELDLDRHVKHLSTGNKQKLSLVLAFMHEANLIILDEPTTGLDPILQQAVYSLVRKANQSGTTIFMSSHNLSEVERLCTRVGILRQGKLVSIETMNALKDKHLYTVSVEFSREYELPPLPQVTISNRHERSTELRVSGDIAPLLKILGSAPVHDLQIQRATLEELFMEFYHRP